MTLVKTLSTLSLSFGLLVGAAALLAPTEAKANGHIKYDALRKGGIPQGQGAKANNSRPGQPANKHTRGCNAITRCRG